MKPKAAQAGPEVTFTEILRWRSDAALEKANDRLAREEPLEIRVRGQSVAVTMRTPGHDDELAAGFLLTEGLIHGRADVVEIAHCRQGEAAQYQNTLNVFLAPTVEADFEQLTRHVFASSSCGLWGKASIEAVHQHFPPIESKLTVPGKLLAELPDRMKAAQRTFAQTVGLHEAAAFDA